MKKLSDDQLREVMIQRSVEWMKKEEFAIQEKGKEVLFVFPQRKERTLVDFNAISFAYQQGMKEDDLFQKFLLPVLEKNQVKSPSKTKWNQVKGKIFPQFKPLSYMKDPRLVPALMGKSPFSDIALLYVVDDGDKMMYVLQQDLSKWGVTADEIHQQAIMNLKKLNQKSGLKWVSMEGKEGFLGSNTDDGYDAVRVLCLDFSEMKKKFKKVWIGMPNRDMLAVFDGTKPYAPRFVKQNQVQFVTHRYQVTPTTYEWDGKGFKPII